MMIKVFRQTRWTNRLTVHSPVFTVSTIPHTAAMRLPPGYMETRITPATHRRVEAAWHYMATATGQGTILPDGRCDIIWRFRYRNGRITGLCPVVTGPADAPFVVSHRAGDGWVGLRLRPGQGRRLWGTSPGARANTALRGDAARRYLPLPERPPRSTADLSAHLHRVAAGLAGPEMPHALDQALRLVHLTGGRTTMAALARTLGISPRHLGRLFHDWVGLPPKTYAALIHFHRAARLLQDGLSPRAAALEAGYADQPHMTRAFRRFAGFPPRAIPQAQLFAQLPPTAADVRFVQETRAALA